MNKLIVRHISSPVPAGALCVITGDFYCENPEIILESEKYIYRCRAISRGQNNTITFRVPEGPFRCYRLWVEGGGRKSNVMELNRPAVQWYRQDQKVLRLFGNGMVNLDYYGKNGYCDYVLSDTRVILSQGDKTFYPKTIRANGYNVSADISDIPAGEYRCCVDHGKGESEAMQVLIKDCSTPDFVIDAAELGMIDVEKERMQFALPKEKKDIKLTFLGVKTEKTKKEEADSAPALQKAFDLCRDHGGGTVYVPNGRYRFFGPVHIYPNTRLIGESKAGVYFELPNGLGGEDGFGTPADGMRIPVFITGDSDFTIENINILSVYSPVVIAAPCGCEPAPLSGEGEYAKIRGRHNVIDFHRSADNVTIRNCFINQEPTYFSQRKSKDDPIFSDEIWDGQGRESKLFHWSAVVIKGDNVRVEENRIKGGGTPVTLYGAQNGKIAGNTLYSGSYANVLALFSSDYYGGNVWHRACCNIVIENNVFDVFSNLCRSVNWIMEDHYNYFISDNDIRPRFWASDSEGINFHLWGDSIHTYVAEGKTNKIVLNREEMKKQYERIPYFANYINPDGTIKDGALNGWELLVCANRGLGQLRRVVRCENNVIYTDAALDCALDGNTMVSIRQYKFFHNTYVLNNNIADCGRAIYYWGCGFNSYVDGNKLKHNGGIVFEDISKYKELRRSWTQFAGNYYNQIIANEVCAGRGFGSNVCIIGACSGGVESGVVSLIVRDNQAADDVSYAAFPRIEADDGLNYMGVVFEKNSVENTKVGFYLSANIEAVLCDNQIKNVDTEYIHAGGNICFI